MEIKPFHGGCGAEILGVDLNRLSDAELTDMTRAQAEHGVVFLRGQSLSPEAQLGVAGRFGPVVVNRFFKSVPGQPEVAVILKEPDHETNVGGGWHADHSYDSSPAWGSMLYALEVPTGGGDTMFASMYKACESLSPGMRHTLEGLCAVHSSRHVFGARDSHASRHDDRYSAETRSSLPIANVTRDSARDADDDAVHPVVIRHPASGRAALYINPGFTVRIDGWTPAESRPLLNYLYEVGSRPEHTCRFQWEVGSVAFWDNRVIWHYALNDYPGQRRLMHRVTLEGEALTPYR